MKLNRVVYAAAAAAILIGVAACATANGDGAVATAAPKRKVPPPVINDPFDALDNPAVGFIRRPYRSH